MNSPSMSSRDDRRFYTLLTKASYLYLSHFAFLLHPGSYLIPEGHGHEAHSYQIFLLINMSLAPSRSAKELRCRACPASFRRINDAERHLKQHPKGLDLDAEYVIYIVDCLRYLAHFFIVLGYSGAPTRVVTTGRSKESI